MLRYRFYKILRMFHLVSKKKYKKQTAKYTEGYKAIARSKLFDAKWYLKHNPDVKEAGLDPIQHYLEYGWIEGRMSSKKFDGNEYLNQYPDVRAANINPLLHYEKYGKYENRHISRKSVRNAEYYENLPYYKYAEELKLWYKNLTKEDLDLKNPKTFNEKIQWLKLYDSTPIKTRLADKYLVRDWIKEKIGEEYLIPLIGVYDRFEDIDFDKLPNQFVIKCNHGSGYNIIVKDKSQLDIAEAKAKIDKWMSENFAFKVGFELHYLDIEPKIIIESFIENKGTNDLYDYKFWCFNGKVEYIQFLSERNLDGLKMAFYDRNWNKQTFVYSHPLDKKNIEKPNNLDLMIKLAEKLAKGFPHVRVDFYRLNDGKIYFGEMTFTSASGGCKWNDEKINQYFGSLIKIPKLAYNIDRKVYCNTEECYKQKTIDVKEIAIKSPQKSSKKLSLSIVVPIYNALPDVKLCLQSLVDAELETKAEIILIDDCSKAETNEYLQAFVKKYSSFKLYKNEQNSGFIKTSNKGVELAKNDIVVILNSDTKVPAKFDKYILDCFESDENIAIASPLSTHSGLFTISENQNYDLNAIQKKIAKNIKANYPLITPEGFCLCLRKSIFDKIGKLDEIFGKGYCEEDDLDLRALNNGYKTVLIDNLIVYHKSHASFTSEKRRLILQKNLKTFRRRWGNLQSEVRKEMNMIDVVKKYNHDVNLLIGNKA